MAEPRQLVAYVADLKFASDLPKDEKDSGLVVKLTLSVPNMTPQDIETLAYMQRDGRTKLTLLQEQLPMFKAGGAKTE
jgi:hypothetical protein